MPIAPHGLTAAFHIEDYTLGENIIEIGTNCGEIGMDDKKRTRITYQWRINIKDRAWHNE